MSAPRKATGGKKTKRAAEDAGERTELRPRNAPVLSTNLGLSNSKRPPGAEEIPPERQPRNRSGGPSAPKLPKPPQGHAGFKHKIERRLPRREGTAPRYTNKNAKQQMLQAALQAAAERGYEAMRISEITDSVGVTRQAFYAHFKDKRHCMAEALDPKLGAIERMAASLSESDPNSAARIAQLLDDLIAERFGSEEGTRGRILSAIGELLSEGKTLHEITIGQIVKAAHIPQGDFYRQFSTKRECFSVYYERLLSELISEVGERASDPDECSAEHTRHDLPECSAEHSGSELPALLSALGDALASDRGRMRILVVESAHLPDSPDPERVGAWRGSLGAAVAGLIGTSPGMTAIDRVNFIAASAVEVIRSVAVDGTVLVELPARLVEVGSISETSRSATHGVEGLAA